MKCEGLSKKSTRFFVFSSLFLIISGAIHFCSYYQFRKLFDNSNINAIDRCEGKRIEGFINSQVFTH